MSKPFFPVYCIKYIYFSCQRNIQEGRFMTWMDVVAALIWQACCAGCRRRPYSAEAQPTGKIHPFNRFAVNFEPVIQFGCPSGLESPKKSKHNLIFDWKPHLHPWGCVGALKIFSQTITELLNYWIKKVFVGQPLLRPVLLNIHLPALDSPFNASKASKNVGKSNSYFLIILCLPTLRLYKKLSWHVCYHEPIIFFFLNISWKSLMLAKLLLTLSLLFWYIISINKEI